MLEPNCDEASYLFFLTAPFNVLPTGGEHFGLICLPWRQNNNLAKVNEDQEFSSGLSDLLPHSRE